MNVFYPPHSSLRAGARVVAYLRDSGGNAQEESVNRQEEEVRRWCQQYGLVLTQIYTDEARTARHSLHKRKDLLSMMAHFRDGGEEEAIIIWNYERFARNIKHGRHFIAEIESLDKVVCSLTDNIPEGPERYFIQDLKLWGAEQTSVKISVDVTSGLRRMVETHGGMPGIPPKGLKRGEPMTIGKRRNGDPRIIHRWEPDPDLAPMVLLAFEMRAKGATIRQIMSATKLFATVNSYTTFFRNRKYVGILEFGDLVIENYCEPIVPMELWNQVQDVGRERNTINEDNNPRRLGSQFLLSGLVFCQLCGSALNGHVVKKKNGSRREYYSCPRRPRRLDCDAREIPARALEADVLEKLETLALDLDRLIQFQARVTEHYKRMDTQAEGKRRKLRRDLRDQDKRIKNLTDAIAERGHSKALFDSLHNSEVAAASLRLELEELEKGLLFPKEYTPSQLSQMAEELRFELHSDDIHKKKHAIHMLTSRIIASRSNGRVEGVLNYIPSVCVGKGTPAEIPTEGIQLLIAIPKYTKAAR